MLNCIGGQRQRSLQVGGERRQCVAGPLVGVGSGLGSAGGGGGVALANSGTQNFEKPQIHRSGGKGGLVAGPPPNHWCDAQDTNIGQVLRVV